MWYELVVIWGRFTKWCFPWHLSRAPSSGHQFVNFYKCCTSIYTNDTETNQLKLEKPENCTKNAILPEAEYFSNVVLQITDGMEHTGGLNMPLFGYLILAWILCFFMVCRGAKDRFGFFKEIFIEKMIEHFLIEKSELGKVNRESSLCNSDISNCYLDDTCNQRCNATWCWYWIEILFDTTMGDTG